MASTEFNARDKKQRKGRHGVTVLRLVPTRHNPKINRATVSVLRNLLDRALRGEVLGVAYVALLDHEYTGDIVGIAEDCPIYVRGLLRALDDMVARRQ